MSRRHELAYALNAGGVDPEAVQRVDLEKMRLAGEHPIANLMPRVLGPLTLRPGLQSLYRVPGDAISRRLPFHRSLTASFAMLLTPSEMRVEQNGAIAQVPSVSTAINSGSWVDASTSPATATGGATLTFSGTSTAAARLRQTVTVASGDQAKANILRIVVDPGNIVLRVGTTSGGEEIIADTTLRTGTHKIAITPNAATIYVELRSDSDLTRTVTQIQFESALIGGTGDLVLPTPWSSSAALGKLRWWRSKDVLYIADGLVQQRQIEHRGDLSWSVVKHQSRLGPYTGGNPKINMTVGALTGNTTVTASENYFRSGHAGALIEITSTSGKTVNTTMTTTGDTSDYVTVTGVGTSRQFWVTTSGTFTGTLLIERSLDSGIPLVWSTYRTYTDAAALLPRQAINDGQDNVRAHYRLKAQAMAAGSLSTQIEYTDGTAVGHARITGYVSATQVNVEVVQAFGSTTATNSWRIGAWSDVLGWPRTPIIVDDRMCWFREDECFGSVVDDYTLHDDTTIGDSGPFIRTVGDEVFWAAAQNRLMVGTPSFEAVIQASEIDTPITPTSFTVRRPSRRKSADIGAAEHDDGVFFGQLSNRRIYEIFTPQGDSRPTTQEITRLIPSGCKTGILRMVVQQQPETRLYTILGDGSVLVLTFDRNDKVSAFTTLVPAGGGLVEDVCILPTSQQDDVSFIVNRSGARYIEKLAPEAEQTAVATCALLDAHKVLTGSISSITGGTHLAGQTVAVWADGAHRASVTLDGSGNGALGATYARVVYGLAYTGSYKSVKLAYAAQLGTAIGQSKQVHGVGLILDNSCLDGITLGGALSTMGPLAPYVDGVARTPSQFFTHYDQDIEPIQSDWGPDARLFINVDSAYGPVTIAALVLDIETREGIGAQARNG